MRLAPFTCVCVYICTVLHVPVYRIIIIINRTYLYSRKSTQSTRTTRVHIIITITIYNLATRVNARRNHHHVSFNIYIRNPVACTYVFGFVYFNLVMIVLIRSNISRTRRVHPQTHNIVTLVVLYAWLCRFTHVYEQPGYIVSFHFPPRKRNNNGDLPTYGNSY